MPRASVWLVRTALLHLGVGFAFGALMLFNKGIPFEPVLWRLLYPHVELVLFGWTMQLAMGVAFWIMPRLSSKRKYGDMRLCWLAYGLLNAGVVAVAVSYWLGSGALLLALAGRIAEFAAAVTFAVLMWPRVKAFGGQAATQSRLVK